MIQPDILRDIHQLSQVRGRMILSCLIKHYYSLTPNTMKKVILPLASVLLTTSLFLSLAFTSHQETPGIIQTTMPMWKMAKTHTLEVLDAMPEEKFTYQPVRESKTFASQMVHIAYTLHFFNERMIKGKPMQYAEPDAASLSKAEIRSMMEANFDEIMNAISELTEEQLAETRPFGPDNPITVAQVILFAHDHTTNHRAKANLYLRMNDIVPPNYKFL